MLTIPASSTDATSTSRRATQRTTRFRWFVLAFGFLVYVIAGADRANIGMALPFIRKEFAMSNTEAGMLLSLFFAGYGIMQIPGGYLISNSAFGTCFRSSPS